MKRLAVLVGISLAGCCPGQGAIGLIAHTAAGAVSAGSPVTTEPINTMGANLIVVGATTYSQDTSNIVLTDAHSNAWTKLNNYVDGSDRGNTTIFYCVNPIVSVGHTFTAAGGPSGSVSMVVSAWSGVAAPSPFDVQGGGSGDFVTSLATNSVTPSQADSLVISVISGQPQASAPVWSVSSPLTILDSVPYSPSNHLFVVDAFEIQTSATPCNAVWSASNGVNMLASSIIAVFKGAVVTAIYPSGPVWIY
jgi:hypothetical protein